MHNSSLDDFYKPRSTEDVGETRTAGCVRVSVCVCLTEVAAGRIPISCDSQTQIESG